MKTQRTLALVAVVVTYLSSGQAMALPRPTVPLGPKVEGSPEAAMLREAAGRFGRAQDVFEAIDAMGGFVDQLAQVARVHGGTPEFPMEVYSELNEALTTIQDDLIEKVEGSDTVTPMFVRGDSNADGAVNLSDAVHILTYKFTGGMAPACLEAADVNDDGTVDVSDPVALLSSLFLGGANPPAPFPGCGAAPKASSLSCNASTCPATIFRAVGGGSGRLSYTCGGGLCSCTGDADCNDLFGGNACKGGFDDAVCYDVLGVPLCFCKQASRRAPGDDHRPPIDGGILDRGALER